MYDIKKEKILYVITKSNWGGAQKYVFDLATQLTSEYEVIVALGGDGELKNKLKACGIRVITVNNFIHKISFLNDIRAFFEIYNILIKERPVIVHINSSKAGIISSLTARIAHIPHIVFTAHGWAFNEPRPVIQKIIIKFFHWLTIIFCHTTICVSQTTKAQFLKWPYTQKKMKVIYNGVENTEYFTKMSARNFLSNLNPELKSDSNILWVGTIAELHKNKGYSTAIKASKILREKGIIWVWIGDGRESTIFRKMISKFKLNNTLFSVGHVSNASKLLHAFDVFVLPSYTEALGYVLLEAGKAFVPIVATKVGGIPEIIENNKTGILVERGNSKKLASAIEQLVFNPEKSKSLAVSLSKKIDLEFSSKKMIYSTKKIYEQFNIVHNNFD